MTNKTTEALKLAEEALNAMLTHMGMDEDEWTKPTFDQSRKTLAAIREALAEPDIEEMTLTQIASRHEPVKQERDARILAASDDLLEIIEAVGHIGVDFGFGEFRLEQSHIEKARSTFIKITEGEV